MTALWRTMLWDWRLLFRQRIGPVAVALTLALSLLAAWNGLQFAGQWRAQADAAASAATEARTRLLADIAAGDSWAALPFSAEGAIVLPPALLADVASGRGDLDPRAATATTFKKQHELFRHYEIDSPLALALGRFDLAFVVQTLLPLLVIALGYGLFAEERERGLDRVLAVQQVPPRRLLAARLLARSALVVVPLLAVGLLSQALGAQAVDSPQRTLRLAWALALVLGYVAFWWALAAWIGTWRLREGQTLLALLAAWVLLVLALPALAGLASRELHPPPSRFELIAAARSQEIAGSRRSEALLGEYAHDHPDLDPAAGADLPGWARGVFLTSRMVDGAVAPVANRFDAALAAQRALVERWQFATPALMLQRGLVAAAGTDERRRGAFLAQARGYFREFRERTGRMMLGGEKLDAQRLDALPRFAFVEPAASGVWRAVRWPLLVLWALSAVLLSIAFRRAGRGP